MGILKYFLPYRQYQKMFFNELSNLAPGNEFP